MAGVGMDRDEQVGTLLVGDGGASFERDEGIVFTRENHLGAEARLQKFAQAPPHFKNQIFFLQPVGTDGARVVTAVSWVNDYFSDLQAQGPDQGAVAACGGLGFTGGQISRFSTRSIARRRLAGRLAAGVCLDRG